MRDIDISARINHSKPFLNTFTVSLYLGTYASVIFISDLACQSQRICCLSCGISEANALYFTVEYRIYPYFVHSSNLVINSLSYSVSSRYCHEIPDLSSLLTSSYNSLLADTPTRSTASLFCRSPGSLKVIVYSHPISLYRYSLNLNNAYNGIDHTWVFASILSPTFFKEVFIASFGLYLLQN